MPGIIPRGRDFKEKLKSIPQDIFSYFRTGVKDTLDYLYKPVKAIAQISIELLDLYSDILTGNNVNIIEALALHLFLPIYGVYKAAEHLLIGARGLTTHLIARPAIALLFFLLPEDAGNKIYNAYYDDNYKFTGKSLLKWIFTTLVAEQSVSDKQYKNAFLNMKHGVYSSEFIRAVLTKQQTGPLTREEKIEFLTAFHNAIEADVIPWSNLADLKEVEDAGKCIRPYNYKISETPA